MIQSIKHSSFIYFDILLKVIVILMQNMSGTGTLLLTVITVSLFLTVQGYFCSSYCADYFGRCSDQTQAGCYVCAPDIFILEADIGKPEPCSLLPQLSILARELNNNAMNLSGYQTTSPSPLTCNNYTFSGQYSSLDHLSKNFTQIPLNHHQLIIRFNIAFLGTWSREEILRLTLQDNEQTHNYDYHFTCDQTQNICNQDYQTTDCVHVRQTFLVHNTSFVVLNFTALTGLKNISVQSWGIKDLIIAAKLCHSYCTTCFGDKNSECLSCSSGWFLQGNVCQKSCSPGYYSFAKQGICVHSCPTAYYADITTSSCKQCEKGCLACLAADNCQTWDSQFSNLWKDKLPIWIALIILCVLVIAFIVFRVIKKIKLSKQLKEEEENSFGYNLMLNEADQKVIQKIDNERRQENSSLKVEDAELSINHGI